MNEQRTPFNENESILVLGGNGKTGSRVVQRLKYRGLEPRVGSRHGNPPFDWEDQSTWRTALEGMNSVYVSYFPDLAVPGAPETIQRFADAAVEAGVRRLVLLSGRGEEEAEQCEAIIQKAGIHWTVVRASWFAQNFSESFLLEPVLSGTVALPAGEVPEPFIDADDIADVATEALIDGTHTGKIYDVTGPRLLTFAEAVSEIGRAAGRDIHYVQVPEAEFVSGLVEAGVPAGYIQLMRYLFNTVLDGRNAKLGDGVQSALNRQPRDFTEFARRTAASRVWDPVHA